MRTRLWLALLAIAITGCAPGENDWGGTIADSAGVAIVSNPDVAEWTLRAAPQVSR